MTDKINNEPYCITQHKKDGDCGPDFSAYGATIEEARERLHQISKALDPIPMRLTCPSCNLLHVDEGKWRTKPHHTHACQGCGNVWRPAVVNTVGVVFLPGFKND